MDFAKRVVAQALLLLMAALLQLSHAAVYKVGDSAGWTTLGNIDYDQWSATKTFKVGDIIRKFPLRLDSLLANTLLFWVYSLISSTQHGYIPNSSFVV
ncbi:hypothetical protein REPUB_Repub15cG0071300 [Reevesia pubescens]